MSVISFSGLVTGLDTNSWVSALTALKNAKVQELQEERAAVVNIKDVVGSIKTYFSSFRTTLERLTDAKFGVDALDLFVQNLANSSDPSKVTATATSSASRDTYEIGVTQLASATKVNTAIRKTFTVTYTAEEDTKLTRLGVSEGYVSINNKEIKIENSDTIGSLLEKLEAIDIEATYEKDVGRFTIATNVFEADEGVTQLFTALGIEFRDIEGKESNVLMTEGYVTINASSLLADIGAVGGNIKINNVIENISLDPGADVQTAINWFNNKYGAGTASIDANGIVTISGLDIEEVAGGSNIITALGLEEKITGVSSWTDALTHVETESAELTTKLGNLNTSFSDYKLILGNGTSNTTINMSSTSSLNDVKTQITNYATANGMAADVQLDEEGTITISGDIDKLYISGGVATGLGLEMSHVNGTSFTSSALSYVITTTAKTSTTFSDLGISGTNLNYNVLDERGQTLLASATVTGGTTIEQWFDSMKQYGIAATISEEGVISVEGGLITGNLATALGLGYVDSGDVVSKTEVVSNALAGTTTTTATMTSKLSSMGITGNQTLSIVSNSGATSNLTFNGDTQLQLVADAIAAAGGTMTIDETGALSISGVKKLSGNLTTSLNLTEHTIEGTSMYNTNLVYTVTSIATTATKLSQLGCSGANLAFSVYDKNGTLKGNVSLSTTSTVANLFSQLSTYGLTGSIDENGVISIENGYITGGLATKLGLGHEVSSVYVSGVAQTATATISRSTVTVTATTTLSELGISTSQYLTIKEGATTTSHTFTVNATIQDILDTINSNGGQATFENKHLVITEADNISGSLLTSLGITATASGEATSLTASNIAYTLGGAATETSKFSDFGISTSGKSYNVYSQNGDLLISSVTLATTATLGDMIAQLESYGLDAYLDSTGALSISNGYITGTMATALGITSAAYKTNVTSVTAVSTVLSAATTTTANLQTTLSQLGLSGNQYLTLNCDGTEYKYTFAATSTLADVRDKVVSSGGGFDVTEGMISISGATVSGSLATNLGIAYKGGSTTTSTTVRIEITSQTMTGTPTTVYQSIKTITTTLTHTDTYVYRSGVKTIASTETNFDPSTTKLNAIGVTNGTVNLYNGSTSTAVYTVTASSTVSDLLATLQTKGVEAKYENGVITISADENLQVQNGTSNFVTATGLRQSIVYETLSRNTTSNELNNQTVNNITATTTLGVFTTDASERVLELNINGEVVSKTFSASQTVQDVLNFFSSNGITATMNNGVFTASSSYQQFAVEGSLGEKLLGSNPVFNNGTRSTKWEATINDIASNSGVTLNTKLINLGVNTGDVKLFQDGEYVASAIHVSETTTLGEFLDAAQRFGFTTSFNSSTGKITLNATSDMYFVDESSNLVSKLGFAKTTSYTTIYNTTSSPELNHTIYPTVTTSTTLEHLGFTNGSEIKLSMDGNVYSLGFSANETMQDVIDALGVYGITATINNGKFTASSTEHLFTLSGDLGKVLATESPTTSVITTVTGYSTDLPKSVNAVNINADAKLVDIGVKAGAIKIYDNGTWINTAINIKDDTTIGDFLAALEGYGFEATLSSGKIKITADSDKYIADETSNLVSKLGLTNKVQTKVNVYDQTNSNTLTMVRTFTTSGSTTLKELGFDSGASLRVEIGGVMQTIGFTSDETVSDVLDSLLAYGINAEINNGTIKATTTDQTFKLLGTLADKLTGAAPTYITTEKVTGHQSDELTEDVTYTANHSTLLSDLDVATGYINVLKDDEILTTVAIRQDTTVAQFFSALQAYGINGNVGADGVIRIESSGDVTLIDGTSDLVSKLGLNDNVYTCDYTGTTLVLEDNVNVATESTLVTYYNQPGKDAVGSLYLSLHDQDGNLTNAVINIDAGDTIGDLITKFEEVGLHAEFKNGQFSYHNGTGTVEITGGTSAFADTFALQDATLERWMQSVDTIEYQQDEIRYLSVCNYASGNTTLETLGVTDGEFALGINGKIYNINVASTDTIDNVITRVSAATGGAVTASLSSDGKFNMTAAAGTELIIGTSTDTSNLVTIFNLTQDGSNVIKGETSLYKASASSKILQSGIFREGDVTEGTFKIGNATFTITSDTTISSLISDINHSEEANANAYWDNINGKMVLTSTALGASYVNVQSGTSNFTDIFGLTTQDGAVEKLNTYNQKLGDNAILTINDTKIISTSNTITSDISRIEGLTVNIKDITPGEYVTIKVERDTQSIVDTVQETLDSYNVLIAELNKALGPTGDLHTDTALRSLKNQLVLAMTGKGTATANQFRNLSGIGISTNNASSDLPQDVYSLYLDPEKFERSLNISEDDVKALLVGTETDPGVLTRVESIIENMLTRSGYFESKTNSLDREIKNLDKKIERAQNRSDSYKAMLEKKFSNMELLYSNMQQSYGNLFSGGVKLF